MSFLPFAQGLGLGASMIIPLGAQNSFVLNQAIKRNYHYIAAAICIFLDIVLMSLGIFGGGQLLASSGLAYDLLTWAGILFLLSYGFMSFKMALVPNNNDEKLNQDNKSLKVVIFTTLAVTLLNPHVYIDAVVILGGVGGQFIGDDKTTFALGIMLASILWFSALSFGGAKLSKVLSRRKVKQSIDIIIALMMWVIAGSLLVHWIR